jgi:transposase
MELYAGMDLHSRNTFVGIMDKESKKRVYEKRLTNDLGIILGAFEPFGDGLKGIVIESTYNE